MILEQVIVVFLFILGAIIGSFLNVCIVRMPEEKSIVTPRSHCPKCKKLINWFDNVPLFSYLILGGKCRHCKASFSPRYFFVELLTALIFVGFYFQFGFTKVLFCYLVMMSGFIIATFVDFKHRIIPDEVSVGGIAVGIFLSTLIPEMHMINEASVEIGSKLMQLVAGILLLFHVIYYLWKKIKLDRDFFELFVIIVFCLSYDYFVRKYVPQMSSSNFQSWIPHLQSLNASLQGFAIGGGIIYTMGILGDLLFRKESMGGGDIKLLAMIGAFLGWKIATMALFIACFYGAFFGIIQKIRTKDNTIAFGPFLIFGALTGLFWGERIIVWYLNILGI